MKRPMTENEKNFFQCALIMCLCGALLLVLKWKVVAIVVFSLAAVMAIIGVCMFIFGEGDKEEEDVKKDTSVSDFLRMEGLASKKNQKK
ncbi:MAG: hypothetical protein Q4D54_01435 [Eubacteriales bacterium]|nr:hypothetical protein [Lachnospiraceae bacterium]MDO5126394.1 hypothetical protein [Eubacteriales bacterium]